MARIDMSRVPPEKLLAPRKWELAMLFLATTRTGKRAREVTLRVLEDSKPLSDALRTRIMDAIYGLVGADVRRAIEEAMHKHGYNIPALQKAYTEGEAKGELEQERSGVLRVLAKRGFRIPEQVQQQIAAEVDIGRLERWHEAAVTAPSLADVFSDA